MSKLALRVDLEMVPLPCANCEFRIRYSWLVVTCRVFMLPLPNEKRLLECLAAEVREEPKLDDRRCGTCGWWSELAPCSFKFRGVQPGLEMFTQFDDGTDCDGWRVKP